MPYQGAQQGWNPLAIIGFVASFLCGIGGIAMGIIAMNQVKRNSQKGYGLAVAAIVIGALNMLGGIYFATSGG
jgi:hypothetical protein